MTEIVECEKCGRVVPRLRKAQRYCSVRCRVAAHRDQRSVTSNAARSVTEVAPASLPLRSVTAPLAPVFVAPVAVLEPINGRTPGALQGDDYLLEYYADGFPILPACLDRRRARLDAAA
jgi:hypothetical protein